MAMLSAFAVQSIPSDGFKMAKRSGSFVRLFPMAVCLMNPFSVNSRFALTMRVGDKKAKSLKSSE